MTTLNLWTAGTRLDGWPAVPTPQEPQDGPEVARLREELQKAMPEWAGLLDTLAEMRVL